MKDYSNWAVLRCNNCNQLFSVPSIMISEVNDGEGYQHLICPYCGKEGSINKEIEFIEHKSMDCKVKKVVRWEIK
jgi:protein-arginine kinase activator protein McsA